MEQSSRPSPLDMPSHRSVERPSPKPEQERVQAWEEKREPLAWIEERADAAVTLAIEGRPHGCLTYGVLLAAVGDGKVDVAKHDAATMTGAEFRRIRINFIEELAKEVDDPTLVESVIRDKGLVLSRREQKHLRYAVKVRKGAAARVGRRATLQSAPVETGVSEDDGQASNLEDMMARFHRDSEKRQNPKSW